VLPRDEKFGAPREGNWKKKKSSGEDQKKEMVDDKKKKKVPLERV